MSEKASPLRERPLHVPGQSIDEAINRLWDDRGLAYFTYAIGFITITVVEWIRWFSPAVSPPWLTTAISLLVVAYCVTGLFRLRRQADRLKLGRDGERAVAEVLDGLRAEGCIVYHDVVGNGFNADHVVLSRSGVFVVETKTISKPRGRARQANVSLREGHINAGPADLGSQPLDQARASAGWVYRLLKKSTGRRFPVKPCVVFPGWFVEPMEKGARDVWVLSPLGLASFISNETRRLPEEDVRLAALHLAMYIRSPWSGENEYGTLAKTILAGHEKRHSPANAA